MKNMPKVSIVTVVRNDAEGFLITARSVLKQTYKNIEWIVVDGASTDGTSGYILNLSPDVDKYIIEKDSGIYNAMNKGIDLVSGEWVVFMNADDAFFDNNTISKYVESLQNDDQIVYASVLRREDGCVHNYREDSQYHLGMVFDHQTAFVRSNIYKKNKYNESHRVSGDLDFFSRARKDEVKFRKIDGFISCIKPFENGVSSGYYDRQLERVLVLKKYFDSDELKNSLSKEYANALKSNSITDDQFKILSNRLGA